MPEQDKSKERFEREKRFIEGLNPKWEYYMDTTERYIVDPSTVIELINQRLDEFAEALGAEDFESVEATLEAMKRKQS